jgi:hypothetical protein
MLTTRAGMKEQGARSTETSGEAKPNNLGNGNKKYIN